LYFYYCFISVVYLFFCSPRLHVCQKDVYYQQSKSVRTTVWYRQSYKTCKTASLWGHCIFWASSYKYR